MLFLILFSVLLLLLYRYVIKPVKYWEERSVDHERAIPIFGSMLPNALGKCSNTELFLDIYKRHSNKRYIGLHNYTKPSLFVMDPQLIKQILVKEFETFPEHLQFIPTDVDPLWNNNLFAMPGGEKWHQLRSILSPAFTSSKLKAMFILMKECCNGFVTYYKSKGGEVDVDVKETFTRFGNDLIASTAFGITCNSLTEPKNEFYVLAKDLVFLSAFRRLTILINIISPTIAKIGRFPFFPKKTKDFFTRLVKDTLQTRREKNIIRHDMLHLLMEFQKDNHTYQDDAHDMPEMGYAPVEDTNFGKTQRTIKLEITDDIITSQVMIFFFAGFETVSTMMSYTIYELALNSDIQDRLRNEVDAAFKSGNGELTYDKLMELKYLDMVILESLRKWPPFILLDRSSVRPYTIEPNEPTESPLLLEKDISVIFPIFSIQRDPKYFPNPDKFDPERFSEENRNNIIPYTYIPFGAGPRNCIGSRFALLEGKLIVAEIVRNFEIVRIEKTQVPIIYSKTIFNPLPDDGIWVGLQQRKFE
ncbi:hypothetical protein PPYR_02096 [Photinus pyralis]|uniref:Cytochrome P450 n=1 Tax=Photinus pyralis TaxID=7054 RepID=A0A5N4B389_PHOPY|nr:cytochrome P450 9e2-like [Photinus pyralis]XP_031342878.1 cytochrome P450 9e2-like [Photinus pyralis]KAB0804062.1 hypothetical protein PPYR_01032 [Photinus pyralis]KAB0805126.1 hypothetical protein PPYR_02096 [Photinus pyralis]